MKTFKQTENKFLNMYETEFIDRNGKKRKYFFASRAQTAEKLKCNAGEKADGVDIVALYGEKLVLIKQYRVPIDAVLYECPAGLIDEGEDPVTAAKRELLEETGLTLEPIPSPQGWDRGFYTSVGMSDEACAVVFGKAYGEISTEMSEASERISVVPVDREEARRILKEERLSLRCALILMEFVGGGLSELFDQIG